MIADARRRPSNARGQRGALLLEALVALLVFSFGVLGIVGLQAQAMRFTGDSAYRAQAIDLANTLIAQMWADDRASLRSRYATGGAAHSSLKARIDAELPGSADLASPSSLEVAFDEIGALTPTSVDVRIAIRWQPPGEGVHRYETAATIGRNP
jgi:type IV pilus assembly protein PilV